MAINIFNSPEHLEPKCPECDSKIDYGITTKFDEKAQTHKCLSCGNTV